MANRELYRLVKDGDDCVIVYRTDHNYGRQGVVYIDGHSRVEYYPYAIPDYIREECKNILRADEFELERGYTYGGKPCIVYKEDK